MKSEAVLGLANYEIVSIEHNGGAVRIGARYSGTIACPDCSGERLRSKGRYQRIVWHESWGMRPVYLILEARKWLCRACGCGFRQQFPGILKWQRASELFRRMIFFRHWDGINRRRLGQREGLASATIERWFQHVLKKLAAERSNPLCPAESEHLDVCLDFVLLVHCKPHEEQCEDAEREHVHAWRGESLTLHQH